MSEQNDKTREQLGNLAAGNPIGVNISELARAALARITKLEQENERLRAEIEAYKVIWQTPSAS